MIGINNLYIRSHVTDSIRHGGNKRVVFYHFTTMPFLFFNKGEIRMLSFFKKKRNLSIYAPVNGEVIPLSFVPDPVFCDKLMGDGIAIIPTDGHFCAPINGKVILIAPTKHAIGLKAEDGTELLIHVGLDTVDLNGEGFHPFLKIGDSVSIGQPLMDVDLAFINSQAKSIISPIIITNDDEHKKLIHSL